MLLSASYSDQNNTTHTYGFRGVLDPVTFLQCTPEQVAAKQCINLAGFQDPDLDPEDIYTELDNPDNDIEILDIIGKLTWALTDDIELVSITAYEDLDRRLEIDEDSSETGAFGGFLQFLDIYTVDTEAFTQELRLTGTYQDRYDWLLGFFYFDEDKDPTSTVVDLEFPPGTPDTASAIDTTSWAIFGHVDAQLTDTLSLIAGIRYTEDDKDAEITTAGISGSQTLSTASVTGNLGLNWRPVEDLLLYAAFSRGFKSGDFNTTLLFGDISAAVAVDEEIVLQYELGAKWEFWEGRGRLNAAGFYQDIADKQGTTIPGNSPVPATRLINFGDVDVYGAEFELFLQPVEALEIIFGLALLDTEISTDPGTGTISTWGAGANGGLGDFFTIDGTKMPGAAELSFNGVVRYSFGVGDYGQSTLQVDFKWLDDQPAFADNPFNVIDAYGLVNLRAFWESPSGRYHANAFVENVGDEAVENGKFFLGGFDYQAAIWGKPRWFGVKVGARF